MKTKFWQLVCLLVGAALLFASCKATPATNVTVTNTTTPTTQVTSTPVITTTAPTTATPTTTPATKTGPQYGGILSVTSTVDASFLDPWNGSANTNFINPVLEKLAQGNWAIDRSVFNFQGTKYVPLETYAGVVAESWEITSPTSFKVKIKQGIKWQNKAPMNGRELTAADIEWTWARNLGLGYGFTKPSPNSAWGTTIPWDSIKAIDKYTVEVKLKAPNLQALEIFLCEAYELSWVEPREVVEKDGNLNNWKDLVGTGPFILTDYVGGSSWTYTKNADYWGYDPKYPQNKLPYVDKMQILIIPDIATRLAGLRTGKIDIETSGNLTQSIALKQSNPEIKQIPWLNSGAVSINFRADVAPFDNVNVRKAMQMAINLVELNTSYYGGFGGVIPCGQIGPACVGYFYPYDSWSQELKDGFAYNVTGAKKLLSDAGYPKGFDTTLDISPGFLSNDADLAQALKSYWTAIGINVTIRVVDRAAYQGNIFAKTQSPMEMWYEGNNYAPINWLKVQFYSKSAWNALTKPDPVYDAMVDTAAAASDRTTQQALSRDCDKYALEKFWALYTPRNPLFALVNPHVGGYAAEWTLGGGTFFTVYNYLWKIP